VEDVLVFVWIVTWLLHICVMTPPYMCYDSFIYVPWRLHMCAITSSHTCIADMCCDSFTYLPWLFHRCAVTSSRTYITYVCQDSFAHVPWHPQICAMTSSYICYDSLIFVPWLLHICHMTHSYLCHDFFIHMPWLMISSHTCMHTCAMTLSHTWQDLDMTHWQKNSPINRHNDAAADALPLYLVMRVVGSVAICFRSTVAVMWHTNSSEQICIAIFETLISVYRCVSQVLLQTGPQPSDDTPQMQKIELKMITTAKISNKFSLKSPYISNTLSRESPKFETNFHMGKRSPRHSKDLKRKLLDLEI